MSAGHGHSRDNLKHPSELKHLLSEGGAPQLMQRWQHLDVDHDMVDLAGYNTSGTIRYLDQDFFKALLDPDYATHLFGEPVDTGMSPEDTVACLLEHEGVEKVILDSSNPIDDYLPAHEFATTAEHEKVRSLGGSPVRYERGLKAAIAWCAKKVPKKVPPDFDCAPLLDDPDANDMRVLKVLRKLGVVDAFKASKSKVDYSKSSGEDQCARCVNWQGGRKADLSYCKLVEGLVRNDRWCKKFDGAGDEAPSDQA